MGPDVDGWPPTVQALIYLAGAVAAIVMWVFGGKSKNKEDDGHIQDIIRELDRARTTADIKDAEQALGEVVRALRESIFTKLEQDKHEIVARLEEDRKDFNEWRIKTDSRLSVLEYMGGRRKQPPE